MDGLDCARFMLLVFVDGSDWLVMEALEGVDWLAEGEILSDWSDTSSAGGVSLAAVLKQSSLCLGDASTFVPGRGLREDVPLYFLSFGARLFFEVTLCLLRDRSIPESPSESVPKIKLIIIRVFNMVSINSKENNQQKVVENH